MKCHEGRKISKNAMCDPRTAKHKRLFLYTQSSLSITFLNVIMTKYQFLTNINTYLWKVSRVIFSNFGHFSLICF